MPRITEFVDGATLLAADVKDTWPTALRLRSWIRKADGAAVDAWAEYPGHGGIHRIGVLANAVPDASYVLDAEHDWRDRLLVMYAAATYGRPADGSYFPGGPSDEWFQHQTVVCGYTRAGVAAFSAIGGNHLKVTNDCAVFARDTDGALMLDRTSLDDPGKAHVSYAMRIIASEQTDLRSAPPDVPALVAVDGNAIAPSDLNALQDHAMLGQFRPSATMTRGLRTVHTAISSMPLGPLLRPGLPGVPVVHTYRGAELRQERNAVGAVRRFFSVQLDNAEVTVIDDSVDWRGRYVWGAGRVEIGGPPPAIQPGGASDTLHNTSSAWNTSRLLGGGHAAAPGAGVTDHRLVIWTLGPDVTISLWADSTTGALKASNTHGSEARVTGMIEGSFVLGALT